MLTWFLERHVSTKKKQQQHELTMFHSRLAFSQCSGLCLLFVLLWAAFVSDTVVALSQCAWVFSANEGQLSTNVLQREWDRGACVGKHTTLAAKGALLPGFSIPSAHVLVVQYTPAVTGLTKGNVRYVLQEVNVACGVFTPLCKTASVHYVVHGVKEESSTNQSGSTATNSTGEAPLPVQPACLAGGVIPTIKANVTAPIHIEPLRYVENCVAPQRLEISDCQSGVGEREKKNYFSIENNVTLWFDRKAENQEEGFFCANLTLHCGGVPSCFSLQATVHVLRPPPPPTPTTSPRNCSAAYDFRVNFLQNTTLSIKPHAADACQTGTSAIFTLVTPPKNSLVEFRLEQHSGLFNYSAPANTEETVDTFSFIIGCTAGDGATSRPVCVGHADIFLSAAPAPSQPAPAPPVAEEVTCPGNFVFMFEDVNEGGAGVARFYNLLLEAKSGDNSVFCPDNTYTDAQLKTKPTYGVIKEFNNKTGEFQYMSSGKSDVDYFRFALTCGTKQKCYATATMQRSNNTSLIPESPKTVYHLGGIICKGTCDAAAWRTSPRYSSLFDVTDGPKGDRSHVTPRHDGVSPDTVDVQVRTNGNSLLFRAYTTIGNMAVRFLTFMPLQNSTSLFLTSESVPKGAHPSFNVTCLDKQSKFGLAESIWTWDDDGDVSLRGHINRATERYRNGENYFHKFGGKHRQCDVFRRDACKYAPMLTPSISTADNTGNDNNTITHPSIDWKLYVNDCDATWVGSVSLKQLRKIDSGATREPLFRLVNGSTLVGTIYTQVVKPARWMPPYEGILSMQRAYQVSMLLRNSVTTSVKIFPASRLSNVKVGGMVQEGKENMSAATTPSLSLKESLPSSFNVSVDVRFANAVDPLTEERLYGYTLVIYPYQLNYSQSIYNVPTLTRVNTTTLHVTEVQLLNASWTMPSLQNCPECTGTRRACEGSGTGLSLDCDSVIRFESAGNMSLFSKLQVGNEDKDFLFFNVSLVARVVGNGTAKSVAESPQGSFALRLRLSTSEVIVVNVEQLAYVEAVNPTMRCTLCRSSAYWPVPGPFGLSLPVKPFNAPQMLFDILNSAQDEEDEEQRKLKYYGPPKPIRSDAVCRANYEPQRPMRILLNRSMAFAYEDNESGGTVFSGSSMLQPSLCVTRDEQVYGVTDWVYVSLHDRLSGVEALTSGHMSLEYLILSVDAGEVLGVLGHGNSARNRSSIDFVLDGSSLSDHTDDDAMIWENEERRWMGEDTRGKLQVYLPWEKYAAYLHYRRIYVRSCPTNKSKASCVTEPFHFAFIPGALLHRGSSARVTFHLRAGVRVTPLEGEGHSRVEEHLLKIPVSAHISSFSLFDREAHIPPVALPKSDGLNEGVSRAWLVVLSVIILAVVAGGVYLETRYRRAIASAKRRLIQYQHQRRSPSCRRKSMDERTSAQHFSPLQYQNGDGAENMGVVCGDKGLTRIGSHESNLTCSGIRTEYGVVQLEPIRIRETDENVNTSREDSA